MNQRLTAQSGTFVIPGVLDRPIDELLKSGAGNGAGVVKLILKTDRVRTTALRELYAMNITRATLFPELNGLAQSLAFELESHWAFDPLSGVAFAGFYTE